MNINVLKFGGSSVANNTNLNIVANKILGFKKQGKDVVVVVSAQGKTTDNLIKEAKELSALPNKRELDALLNIGEQITASKLAILLNRLGYEAISLNGWQAGIKTDGSFQNAKIVGIDTSKIIKQLKENKIVVITGFQGIDCNNNITTLGRGGSDTSAVAIASVLNAEHCYIFSDVEGIYTSDPNKVTNAQKLDTITYKEMQLASNAGAKVLHDRCVELAEKYNTRIIAASTFSEGEGTLINNEENIEKNNIKSIIKNDDILLVKTEFKNSIDIKDFLKKLLNAEIKVGYYKTNNNIASFSIMKKDRDSLASLTEDIDVTLSMVETSKISVIGTGISNNFYLLNTILDSLEPIKDLIKFIDISSYKISIQLDRVVDDSYLTELHSKLFCK